MTDVIDIDDLQFRWQGASASLLQIDDFKLAAGERVFLCGQSGSGKSTLLNLITGVQDGYSGQLQVLGQEMRSLRPAQRDSLRAASIGYIFQQFNLLPYLSVLDNAGLPCRLSPERKARAIASFGSVSRAALTLMTELGLDADCFDRAVSSLSIGQQQRVAAVRALIGGPELIIADEPTSALDTAHRQRFMQQLLATCGERGISLLFVSHDNGLREQFDRVVSMEELNQGGAHVLD